MNTQILIDSIKTLESNDSIDKQEFLTDGDPDLLPPIVKEVVNNACDLLITSAGQTNFNAIAELKKNNITVGPGETDSFGWLTGVIYTTKGKIVFG